jgi:WD40 repeat protein
MFFAQRRMKQWLLVLALLSLVGRAASNEDISPALSIPQNRMTHHGSVNSVVYSPDGKLLASSSDDGTVKIWKVENTKEELLTLKAHRSCAFSVAFSPDGSTLASSGGDWTIGDWTIKLWDVKTGKEKCTLEGHTERMQRGYDD